MIERTKCYLRVTWADQNESRGMTYADSFPFHGVPARSLKEKIILGKEAQLISTHRGVKEHIHEVIVQKVDFIDVQDTSIRLRNMCQFESVPSYWHSPSPTVQVQKP